jgi:predicted dehydrogenase
MVHWGILGAGNIAHRFAKSLAHEKNSELVAISARNEEKAAKFCEEFHVPRYYLSHQELLEDPAVDAIYLALPHGLHKEWAVRALNHKKAVLCEKPASLSAAEMEEIAYAARQNHTLFLEAMKTRFLPAYDKAKELLCEIGEIRSIKASCCNDMPFDLMPNTYHTQAVQGGALLDCGIYCAGYLQDFLMQGTDDIFLEKIYGVKDTIDFYTDAFLQINGVQAELECAFDRSKPKDAVIEGTKGTIIIKECHRPQQVILTKGSLEQSYELPYVVDDFYGEISHFTKCLISSKQESDVMPLNASVECAQLIDIIRRGYSYIPEEITAGRQEFSFRYSKNPSQPSTTSS